MPNSINNNLEALTGYQAYMKTTAKLNKLQVQLVTKKVINSVSDDVSGYNVSKSLESKVQLMKAAQGNISSAKDMLSTAESALSQVKDKLTEIRKLVADVADPTKDKKALADAIVSLGNEIKNIFDNTKFNNTKLLSGDVALSCLGGSDSTTPYTASQVDTTSGKAKASLASLSNSFTFQTGADTLDRLNLDFASGLASAGKNYENIDVSDKSKASGTGISDTVFAALSSFINLVKNADNAVMGGTANDSIVSQVDFATSIASLASDDSGSMVEGTTFRGDLTKAAKGEDKSILGKMEYEVNVALNKIGNFQNRLTVKDDYTTAAITNATASVARLTDTNMIQTQLDASKEEISASIGGNMLSKLMQGPQRMMVLFQ